MTLTLWWQIMAFIVTTGFMTRHALEAKRQRVYVTITKTEPADQNTVSPRVGSMTDRGHH